MLRTGIYNLVDLKNNQLFDLFGKEKNISIKLYNYLLNSEMTDNLEYEKLSEIILNRFNTNSNAIKRTYRNRFNEFDLKAIKTIKRSNFKQLNIHDMAISDGRASSFFIDNILRVYPDVNYTGSDIAMSYNCYKFTNTSKSYIITDDNNKIIEITLPPFVWNYARNEGKIYFLNNLLKSYNLGQTRKKLSKNKLIRIHEIKIADREFLNILKKANTYKIINYNLFEKQTQQFNVIRIMNILHFGYFNENQIKTILNNIYNSLETNGILIEGNNEDPGSPVDGAIYQKTDSGFVLIEHGDKNSRIAGAINSYITF